MAASTPTARLNGLDTLRAAAIILVLISHYTVVVSGKNTFGFLSEIGWAGVDLFFVLSGYLIGNQVFASQANGATFSLKTFYIRRALRTLPNYIVLLALYWLFPAQLAGKATAALWRFLTFTQNFGMHPGETFTHSWSLCVEEQFYLILPVVAILIAASRRQRTLAWCIIAAAIGAGVTIRGMAWLEHGRNAISSNDYYQHIYYSSFARFDELLPGVAIALLKNFHPAQYQRILRRGNALLLAGVLATASMFYLFAHFQDIEGYGVGFFMSTFGYSLLAASFGILTLAALSPASLLHRLRVPGATSIALWSYALYLAHKPIFKLAIAPMAALHIDTDSVPGIGLIMLASLLGGWLLYRLVETPFMRLRERLSPATTLGSSTSRSGASTMCDRNPA